MARIFHSLFRRRRRSQNNRPRPRTARLDFDVLEDRTVPTTLIVGPTAYASLQAAINASSAGDVIQIVANSTPGTTANITASNITIQGDPNAPVSALPDLGYLTVATGTNHVTLQHLRMDYVTLATGSSYTTVRDTLILGGLTEVGGGTGNGHNLVTLSDIRGTVQLTGNDAGTPTADALILNRFGTSPVVINHDDSIRIQQNQSHDFSGSLVLNETKDAMVERNQVGTIDVIALSPAAADATATIRANRLHQLVVTGAGNGTLGTAIVRVEGNDFRGGAALDPEILSSFDAAVDAGGGIDGLTADTLGASVGDNFFRGLGGTSAVTTLSTFSFTRNTTTYSLSAQSNVWLGGATDLSHIDKLNTVGASAAPIDETSPLTGEQAFVLNLYTHFLQRPGALTELNFWVDLLHGNGSGNDRPGIIRQIGRSKEAYTLMVRDWYLTYLGRPAGNNEEAGWVGMLLTTGREELVIASLLGSQEYLLRAGNTSAAFIQALYSQVLSRDATAADVAFWSDQITRTSRTQVALELLSSGEYRRAVVTDFYFALLHRSGAPSAGELAFWVNSNQDVLSINLAFIASPEFFNNG
jgi:hypothetical protein